ncbi:HipA domain protein [Bifidobacterium longum]|nr:HipA protein [Bifidobacterium longum subsp. longum KACC 91563]ALE35716.1 HipA domain protein [Bifidobacterium longum]
MWATGIPIASTMRMGDVFVECLVWKGRYAGLDDMSRPRDSSGGEP